ncbi:hypothetical protein [Nonomuraea sp. NPDC049504]|uniref:hypothetical protein n=1 Tax=Nonomuraea sp. NPDC049504 TaxID=3154729 RepID=UPI00342EFD55
MDDEGEPASTRVGTTMVRSRAMPRWTCAWGSGSTSTGSSPVTAWRTSDTPYMPASRSSRLPTQRIAARARMATSRSVSASPSDATDRTTMATCSRNRSLKAGS